MAEVAVVTRTRSRPLLLERALSSVSSQTLRDFVWVLVNDGGDKTLVESIAARARGAGLNVLIRHIVASRGMEAASNEGIRSSASDYVAIHDDDDSWAPEFLAETVHFLNANRQYEGVVSHATRVNERIDGGRIVRLRREPHRPLLQAIHLADMARSNLFPPISFCYRRSLYESLGGYDESMQILGDWDFNLRALLQGDIGIIPKALANYHVRAAAGLGEPAYANSIVPGDTSQGLADAAYRNRMIRRDVETGKPALGMLLAVGRLQVRSASRKNIFRASARVLSGLGIKSFMKPGRK